MNVASQIRKFHELCREKRQHYVLSQIINADETNVQLDAPDNYTYEKKGTKKVGARTTGQQKTNLPIMLAATANGDKLQPVFIIPRKRKLKDEPLGCIIEYKGNSKTFDSNVIEERFLGRSVSSYMISKGFKKAMLTWDNATPHKTPQTKHKLKEMTVDDVLIPPRTTPFLQPADLSWMREIKRMYHAKWTNWWLNDKHAFTKENNLKSPGYVNAMKWVLEAWDQLDKDIIIRSFESTGITCSNEDNFNSLLKYVLQNTYFPGRILDDVDESDEIVGFVDNGDTGSEDGDTGSEDGDTELDETDTESDETDTESDETDTESDESEKESDESGTETIDSDTSSDESERSESENEIEIYESDSNIGFTGPTTSKNANAKKSK